MEVALKRTLKIFLVGFASIVVLGLLFGLLGPRGWDVERSTAIAAAPAEVYAYAADLSHWQDWAGAGGASFKHDGPDTGAGASVTYQVGEGSARHITLTRVEPGKGIWYRVTMDGSDMATEGSIAFEADGDGTRVIWHDHGELPIMIGPYVSAGISGQLGDYMEGSLGRLKAALEPPAKP